MMSRPCAVGVKERESSISKGKDKGGREGRERTRPHLLLLWFPPTVDQGIKRVRKLVSMHQGLYL